MSDSINEINVNVTSGTDIKAIMASVEIKAIIAPPLEIKASIVSTGPRGIQGVQGIQGKGLNFDWQGTALGVKVDGDESFQYAELRPDSTFTYVQVIAAKVWKIEHSMGKYPSVTIVDTAGSEVEGDILYVDINNLQFTSAYEFSGKAYLN